MAHTAPNHTPITLTITDLTHDGRGVASYDEHFGHQKGKKIFVSHALPDEVVNATLTKQKTHYDEADSIAILKPSPHRTKPMCPHFGVCGGCALQHLKRDEQLIFKQSVLKRQFAQVKLSPDIWLCAISDKTTHYRTKARLGVRYLKHAKKLIIGFRQRNSNFLTDIDTCPVLDKRVGTQLSTLKALIARLHAKDGITHLELAMGDDDIDHNVAMIIRHTKKLPKADKIALSDFAKQHAWQIYLQPKDAHSTHRLDVGTDDKPNPKSLTVPPTGGLYYRLPEFGLSFEFSPLDFTQINLSINRQMTKLACDLLDLKQGERVLDLFCGLGNFSLAMACQVGDTGRVIGVEGSKTMTERAKMNARINQLNNTQFYAQDLTQDFTKASWVGEVDALLIDPPRSGALAVMSHLGKFNAKRIVYVSCDPATLARDSALLIAQGYRLTHAGVMDMFGHTAHVESIARFEKITAH